MYLLDARYHCLVVDLEAFSKVARAAQEGAVKGLLYILQR